MMDDVSQIVAITEYPRARLRMKLELQTALAALGARLHPHFGHTFADWRRVNKTSGVTNRVEHTLRGQRGLDRISDVLLMNREMYLRALALDVFEVVVNVVGHDLVDL